MALTQQKLDAAQARLDEQISNLRNQAERLQGIRDTPELLRELLDVLQGEAETNGSTPRRQRRTRQNSGRVGSQATGFERIKQFFQQRNNQWASSGDVIDGAGIPRGMFSNIVYRARKSSFESRRDPENEKRRQYRLHQ